MGIDWAVEEMRYLRLKDKRLVGRTKAVIRMLSERPAKSVPEASQNWAETKGVYRMWSNRKVAEEAIRQAHYQATRDRVAKERRVLAIQDTTELNFTGKKVGEALGMLSHKHARGVLMHSVLTVSEQGVPLGLVHQYLWTRDPQSVGISEERHKRKTEEKESQRWLDGVLATEALLGEEIEIVHIADREADLYDLFALPRQAGSELLIRVHQNRRVEHEADYLWEAVRQVDVAGQRIVQVSKQANRQPRTATCQVRYATLSVRGPEKGCEMPLQFVLVEEQNAPQGCDPIEWLLATTLPVTSLADALQCIDYYCLRWLIERFHYVLKSGCRVEQLYLQTPDRLLRALAVYSIVAWRILWLTYEARQNPDQPCDTVLQTHEWQALYCTIHQTTTPPTSPPTFHQAVLWIAKLGGFLGRTGDGSPGAKTIWQGLRRLDDIAATWLLLNPPYPE
jgi:hypothetical protein